MNMNLFITLNNEKWYNLLEQSISINILVEAALRMPEKTLLVQCPINSYTACYIRHMCQLRSECYLSLS